MYRFITIVALTILLAHTGLAQKVKKEYERGIKEEEMPSVVIQMLKPMLEEANKIDYYEESNDENTTYEVKMNWQDHQLSIEFYDDGQLMDIEQLIKFREVSEEAKEEIREYLQGYKRSKITRLQRQFTAEDEDDDDEEVFEEFMEGDWEDLTIRYEMEVYLKGQDKFGPYELLFDDEGELLDTRKIERRSADNVLY